MAKVNTSHYNIFKYWQGKVIHPDGSISDAVVDGLADVDVVPDSYVPRCWACGAPVVRDSKLDDWIDKVCAGENGEEGLRKIWNSKETRSKLNRCHIVPGMLGGEDAPSNLFLMCEECHTLSPDTIYPSVFFKWVVERHNQYLYGVLHPRYVFERVDKMLREEYNTSIVELSDKIYQMGGEVIDLEEFMKNRVGFHASSISDSSWLSVIKMWMLCSYTDVALKYPVAEVG